MNPHRENGELVRGIGMVSSQSRGCIATRHWELMAVGVGVNTENGLCNDDAVAESTDESSGLSSQLSNIQPQTEEVRSSPRSKAP